MTLQDFVFTGQWIFLAYFVGINVGYLLQNVVAAHGIRRYLQTAEHNEAESVFSALDIPISIVVPAYNESVSIITSVKAMLQLEYPEFELVVVNDGSTDDTLQKLIDEFGMRKFPEAYRARVQSEPVKAVYRSARYSNLSVVDKVNGGSKADASNAGINVCRYPLVCVVDADSILQPDSLRRGPTELPIFLQQSGHFFDLHSGCLNLFRINPNISLNHGREKSLGLGADEGFIHDVITNKRRFVGISLGNFPP